MNNSRRAKELRLVWGLFTISFLLIVMLWFYSRPIHLSWSNVPPAPSKNGALAFALGDQQMAYRSLGMMLQFFGNTAGRYERLDKYDYQALSQWFTVMDRLDEKSEFLPFLVAYYYGASQKAAQLRVVIDFLEKVGLRVGQQKWRWLAQAVFIARYRIEDYDKAIELSEKLASHDDSDVEAWARNLKAIVLDKMGEKEAAIMLSLSLLQSRADRLTNKEVYYLQSYICDDLLEDNERGRFAFCNNMKKPEE